jgi:peptide/nickel transport system permease protein
VTGPGFEMIDAEMRTDLEDGGGAGGAFVALSRNDARTMRRRQHFVYLLRSSHMLQLGTAIVVVALFLTAFGPMLAPDSTTSQSGLFLQSPSLGHLFGTDSSGFDVLSRTLAAPRIDVLIAIGATLLSFIAGSLVGLLASATRGRTGALVMRISDTIQASPLFVLAVVFVVLAGRSSINTILVISTLQLPIYLRLIRSEVLSLRERTFIEAARANGDSSFSIALRHILPNALTPAFAQAPITFGFSILVAAGLSFIGAGTTPPTPEWGSMISAGKDDLILGVWWTTVFPGIALSLTVMGFAVIGGAVQSVVNRSQ